MDIRLRPNDEEKYTPKGDGAFKRGKCRVQNWIEEKPEKDRYPCFKLSARSCGWSHQVLITLKVKGLMDCVSVSHVGLNRIRDPDYRGWSVPDDPTGSEFDQAFDIYKIRRRKYGTTQMTIPILFDKKKKIVVSNDPAHIILMFNEYFNNIAKRPDLDLYPKSKRVEIEKVEWCYLPWYQ